MFLQREDREREMEEETESRKAIGLQFHDGCE